MKYFYPILIIALLSIDLNAQVDPRLENIDEKLEAILEATMAPSFAVAVVDRDKVIYAKGFGYRDFDNKIPADEHTLYAIGSSTKAFTSSILGQLRDDNKLTFADSPIKHVPELRFYNDELNSKISIKDIMCHRTGIPRHDLSWYLFPTFNRDSLIMRIEHQEPFTGLREEWYYNNFMFLTQGVIAERITGMSWEDNIRTRFFEKLDMTRSNVSIKEMENSSNAAFGYEVTKDSITKEMDYYKIAAMAPAGSINSSVSEMSNWLITWINGGKYQDKDILSEHYLTEAMSPQMIINNSIPDSDYPDMHLATYGYGWMISSYKGHYRVEHGGNIDGFSASASFFPTDSIGIMVLTNQNGSAVPSLVRNTIADQMIGAEPMDWVEFYQDGVDKAKEAEESAEKDKGIEGTKPSHILQDYTGNYSHPGYGTFEITLNNDSLFAHFKLMKGYLKHKHYDVFKFYEVEDEGVSDSENWPLVNFVTNDAGDISIAKIAVETALDAIEFKRTPNTIEVDLELLQKYEGEYELMGTPIKVYLKNDDTLYLFVTGQPEYELLPTSEHKFSFKTLEGFKVEFIETEGVIKEVKLIQPNGTFKATRK